MSRPPSRRKAPETAGLARQLYQEGAPLVEITRRTGLSAGQIYYWMDRQSGADGAAGKPAGRRRVGAGRAGTAPRRRLLARLWRVAERQVDEIEDRMARAAAGGPQAAAAPRPPADTEKDARALALLARTLRELAAAEDDAPRPTQVTPEDDTVRDLDDFRRELARRLDHLRAAGAGAELPG